MQKETTAEKAPARERLARIFASYALLPNASSANRQLNELGRTIPFFLFFHLSAAVSVNVMIYDQAPQVLLGLWQAGILITAGAMIYAIYESRKNSFSGPNAAALLKASPLIGFILAIIWMSPPLVFSHYANHEAALGLFWISFTVLTMGAISLVRLPAAAILFSILMTIAIAYGTIETLQVHPAFAFFIALLLAFGLVGAIVAQHYSFLRHYGSEVEMNRQSQVIKLLLNDFERGTSDWLWETNDRGELQYFSPRLATIFAMAPDQMFGMAISQLFDRQVYTSDHVTLASLMDGKSDIVDQPFTTSQNGQLQHWQISARPLHDEAGVFQGYRGVGRDVTIQTNHDQQIENAMQEATKANAAKSQFLAVISHELRTPINAIVGFSEVLNNYRSDDISSPNNKEYLTTILESARHLQGLINDILDATRIERGALQLDDQPNDAAELVETAIKICRSQASRNNVSIIAHVIDDVLLTGDLTRLKQVILNLITNAIKFSPEGGVVNIDMRKGPDQQLIISIRDAGIGISAEDAERVFEPFVQVDDSSTRKFGGMGLGLAIARKVARLHGGDVSLNGAVGIGTEALFTMPAARIRWPRAKVQSATVAA